MSQTTPTFLIVGSAKSGTTSMYHYLKNHPSVFMCPVKEPDYFGGHFWQLPLHNIYGPNPELKIYQDWDEYLSLYEAGRDFKVCGEASPSTLYFHKQSIPEIKARLGNPKIIILLRNPVDRAYSHYNFLRRDGKENLSFKESLMVEEQRKNENYHYGYFYKSLSMYNEQVSAFLLNFDEVYIQLYDELRERPLEVFNEICSFLEISTSYVPETDVHHNKSGTPRFQWLNSFFRGKNPVRDFIRPVIDTFLSEQQKSKFVEKVHAVNLKSNQGLSASDRAELKQIFQEDLDALSITLQKDLSEWM